MIVQFGNNHAVEGYRDPNSDDPEKVRYRSLEGEHVTTLSVPDETPLAIAFDEVVGALKFHIEAGEPPAWVECDNEALKQLLADNYGLSKSSLKRPKSWGGGQ